MQKSIKKNWEDKEPGREEKSKKSRKRFLLITRKENGETLDGKAKSDI